MIARTCCVYCGERCARRVSLGSHNRARDARRRYARLFACNRHVDLVALDPSYPHVDKSVDDNLAGQVYARTMHAADSGEAATYAREPVS